MTIMCFIRWNYDNLNMKKKKNYILLFFSYRNTAQHISASYTANISDKCQLLLIFDSVYMEENANENSIIP